jgi:hypothetical protein
MKGTINNNGRMSQKQTITYPVLCYDVLSVTQLRPTQELSTQELINTYYRKQEPNTAQKTRSN